MNAENLNLKLHGHVLRKVLLTCTNLIAFRRPVKELLGKLNLLHSL